MKRPSTASWERYIALLLGTVGLLWSTASFAVDPRNWGPPGQPIRQGHHIEWQRAAIRSDNGYTLVVWSDTRTGDRDVYAQLIEPDGDFAPGWPVQVVHYPYRQEDPEPIPVDGGFIVTWIDFRFDSTGDVFAQKLDYAGNLLWNPVGAIVDTFVSTDQNSMVNETTLRGAHDGSGGAVIAWESNLRGDVADIYAMRINSNGQRAWNEVLGVTESVGVQTGITADTDGQGGLIVGWNDNRDGGNVYAAKITNAGTLPWGGVGGRVVCDFTARQLGLKLCPDFTTGGAFFAWQDERNGSSNDLYIQRFNGAGAAQWAEDGIPLCTAADDQRGVRVTPSFNGGVQDGWLTCWQDVRVNGSVEEVFAQKLNLSGVPQWTENGVRICGDAAGGGLGATRDNSRLTSDLQGGGLYVWDDTRLDPGNILQYDTYMAHLNASGSHVCNACGVAIRTAENQQQEALLRMSGDGSDVFVIYADFYRGSRTLSVAQASIANCAIERTQEAIFGLDGDATNPTNIHMFWGNVAFVWEDNRGVNFGKQVYYQVLDTTYAPTFAHIPANGAPIAPVSAGGSRFDQSRPYVCTDGNNGFYCSFENLTEGVKQIRIQQVGWNGQLQCDLAGTVVSAAAVDQQDAQVAPDGQGGVYVVWSGFDPSFQLDVYAMRMGPNCEALWTEPVLLSSSTEFDDALQGIVADGNGCVVAVWQTGDFGNYNLRGAKVCGDGSVAWSGDVSASPREQTEASIVADGQGGVYVAWSDSRNQLDEKDVYGQHFNAAGEPQWTNNGSLIVNHDQDQKIPRMAVDSQGNVFVMWQDFRNGNNLDLYGQKLSSAGTRLWTPLSGKPFCTRPGDQADQQLLVEWSDGLYMAWEDGRANPFMDLYGVHISPQTQVSDAHWGTLSETEARAA
ncbi:MAG: hypothetical protein IPK53_20160 [bacterium]|nr:hypothetical protein [bacterium]